MNLRLIKKQQTYLNSRIKMNFDSCNIQDQSNDNFIEYYSKIEVILK